MGERKEVKQTPNIEHRTSNAELSTNGSAFDVRRSAFGVRRFPRLYWICRILDFIIGGIFIYAGALKVMDPVGFARDIDNYKILPWPACVALGFFLPWLEMFTGLALITGGLYRGGLVLLVGLTSGFIAVSIKAKARGLDITCGCFGHVSKGWSFGWHMALDFGILAVLLLLWAARRERRSTNQPL
jgi:putative oxidoreductase